MTAAAGCAPAKDSFCNLNSATLDLSGGNWAVSDTVKFPSGYTNYNIRGGTITALLDSFPVGATLLQIGEETDNKGDSAKNINLERLTINGQGLAGTAVAMWNGQNVNMGPALMVYGFTEYGIRMTGTGAGYIHHSWLGQEPPYLPSAHMRGASNSEASTGASAPSSNLTATCISLEGDQHDCYVQDVIIWSGLVGVKSQNGANKIEGVHTWNLMTTEGGRGIEIEKGMGSVKDSYLDFNALVITDCKSMVASGNLFLARGNLVLRANRSSTVEGLVVTNNRWWGEGNPSYKNDTIVLDGNFTDVSGVTIESNSVDSIFVAKGTRATASAAVAEGATNVTIDFSKDLLFPDVPIREVHCTLVSSTPVPYSVAPLPSSREQAISAGQGLHNVTVLLGMPAGGQDSQVHCTVDQSKRIHGAH